MRFLRQVHTILGFYLLLSCAGALNLSAQDFRGALRGIVQDASGGRVPAAKILIHGNGSSPQEIMVLPVKTFVIWRAPFTLPLVSM